MLQFLRANAPFLATGFLLTLASSFGQTFFISIFAGEIRAAFALSHGDWGGLYGMATTASAIVMVWAGTLTDHVRVRVLGPTSMFCLALAAIAMTLAPSWVALFAVIFALRLFGQGMLSHIAVVAMARWYVARRGKALSIAGLGYALGETALPITFVSLMAITDWRNLWLVGACVLFALIPVIFTLMRRERTPRSEAEREDATGMLSRHWTRPQAMRHWLLWLMVPAVMGPSAFITALFFQQVHFAEVRGWSHAQLVALYPIYTVFSIGSMLAAGAALDRLGTPRLLPLSELGIALGFIAFWATDSLAGAALGYALVGFSQGAYSTLFNAFWAEVYGTRFIGSIKSLVAAFMVLGSAMGPWITGKGIDAGYDFPDQMPMIAGYFIAVTALIWLGVRRTVPLLARAP